MTGRGSCPVDAWITRRCKGLLSFGAVRDTMSGVAMGGVEAAWRSTGSLL